MGRKKEVLYISIIFILSVVVVALSIFIFIKLRNDSSTTGDTKEEEKNGDMDYNKDQMEEGDKKKEEKEITDSSVSGEYAGSYIWSGEITITGDTVIKGNLTVEPGTVVKFVVGDDQNSDKVTDKETTELTPADQWSAQDPTYTDEYQNIHSSLVVEGVMTAKGTKDEIITFTSASENPTYADWSSIGVGGDGSIFEYCLIEWGVLGISFPKGEKGLTQTKSIVQNSRINHIFGVSICVNDATVQILDNEIREAGHAPIELGEGSSVIRNNKLYDSRIGILVGNGSPTIEDNEIINVGQGIFYLRENPPQDPNALHPNNVIVVATPATNKIFRYENFAYQIIGDPILY